MRISTSCTGADTCSFQTAGAARWSHTVWAASGEEQNKNHCNKTAPGSQLNLIDSTCFWSFRLQAHKQEKQRFTFRRRNLIQPSWAAEDSTTRRRSGTRVFRNHSRPFTCSMQRNFAMGYASGAHLQQVTHLAHFSFIIGDNNPFPQAEVRCSMRAAPGAKIWTLTSRREAQEKPANTAVFESKSSSWHRFPLLDHVASLSLVKNKIKRQRTMSYSYKLLEQVFNVNHVGFRREIQPGQYVSGAPPKLLNSTFADIYCLSDWKNATKKRLSAVSTLFFSR